MKRVLIFCVVVGLFAGQATAAMYYTLTPSYAMTLDDVWYSDALPSTGANFMTTTSPTTSQTTYGPPMQGDVGFFGSLDDTDDDDYATVKMGDPGADLSLNLWAYTDYALYVANDNQDIWGVALYLIADGTEYAMTTFTDVGPYTAKTLVLNFATASIPSGPGNDDLENVTDIGFYIRGHLIAGESGGDGYPSDSDTYHISVVPVPGAVILGILGLGVVGIKLRKYA